MRELGPGLHVVERPLSTLGVPFGRRMSVVDLPGGGVFVHSPAPLDDELRAALDARGGVRFVAAASLLHGHLFMEQYEGAELLAPPGLARRRRDLTFAAELGDEPDPRWAGVLDQALFRGNRSLVEVVFLHRPTRSLIVGDLVWHVAPPLPLRARLFAGGGGVRPTLLFRAFSSRRRARPSLERILAWDFDRIVVGHGPLVERDARDALRRAWA
ncbi:MAG TPA: hypothetical protein VHF89_18195 [Solirubrobacteraceae bacterium]|nr:hypothetical protein [Solirubrobacteraceae bacterium]